MGVPSVLPSNVPERICTVSLSLRGETISIARAGGGPSRAGCRLPSSEPRRAAVHHHADSAAVGFPPGGDAEEVPKGVCHAQSLRENSVPVKFGTG